MDTENLNPILILLLSISLFLFSPFVIEKKSRQNVIDNVATGLLYGSGLLYRSDKKPTRKK